MDGAAAKTTAQAAHVAVSQRSDPKAMDGAVDATTGAAPQTPQRRRTQRGQRGNGKSPPSGLQQEQKRPARTPQVSKTPQTGTTATPGVTPCEDDSDDEDGAGILGDLCADLVDEDLQDEEPEIRYNSWVDSRPASKGQGKGRTHVRGGVNPKYGVPNRPGGVQRESSRLPPPPSSQALKALPQEHVGIFLKHVEEQNYAEALKALRKVRRAVKGRGCSKEAFGGMRALLHHLLEGYAAAGRLTEAIAILQDMKGGAESRLVSAAAFNAVLRGLLSRGALDEARFVVRTEMPRLGATPNEASLNILMDTAARAGYTDEAWDILEEMQRRSLRADKYTVSILTKGISERAGDKWRAPRGVALVEHFLASQPEDVDEVLVNSLLDVFCRMSDVPRLETTLTRMRALGIKGSAVTYGTIVKAYGRAGNIEKVLNAWQEMSRVGLEANAVTYGCMLDACVKCGHLDKAINVFAVMKEQGLHRNTILYATLIKGFAKSKDPGAARKLHKEMVSEGVPCNVVVFNSLIDACVRANDLTSAAEVLQEMTVGGVRPDLITFSTLIKGYCSSGEISKAMRLAEELQARKLECDEIVFNSLLEGCVKVGDLPLGMQLFTDMKMRGVRPSSVTFSILVKLLSRTGRLDLAFHLVAVEMREMHGVTPTRMVWSCLVTCCVKSRDLARAVQVLNHLDAEGNTANAQNGARGQMFAGVIEGCLGQPDARLALQLCYRAYQGAQPEEYSKGGLLSADLLRRVFEAAGTNLPEEEARSVLASIGSRMGDQTTKQCQEAFERGAKRGGRARNGASAAAGDALSPGSAASAPDAGWNGSAATAVAQQWAAAQQYPAVGSTAPSGLESATAYGGYGGVAPGMLPPQIDPAIMAAAAAAVAANPWAYGLDSYPGYPPPAGYGGLPCGAPDYSQYYANMGAAGWPYMHAGYAGWDGSADWAAAAAAAQTPGAPAPASTAHAPSDPAIIAVGQKLPSSPEPATVTATPSVPSVGKRADWTTPATTAPRSGEQSCSPAPDEDADVNATVRLFAGELSADSPAAATAEDAAPVTLPPGLC